MLAYIARRLLFMVPTLFGILLINFGIVQFAPGGPVERILAQLQGLDSGATGRFGGGGCDDICDCRARGGRQRAGLQESTTIHDASPKIDGVAGVAVATPFSASIIGAGRGSLKRHFRHA